MRPIRAVQFLTAILALVLLHSIRVEGEQNSSGAVSSTLSGPASTLVGFTEAQVRSALGGATSTQRGFWYYDSPVGTLTVEFEKGLVSAVRPADFELLVLSAKSPAERTAAVEAIRAKAAAEAAVERERAIAKSRADLAEAEARAATLRAEAEAARAKAAADLSRKEAEPLTRVTYLQAQAIMKDAAASAANDADAFTSSFLRAVWKIAPEFKGPLSVEDSDALSIWISGPLGIFYSDARERVRKFEALTPAPGWQREVQVIVSPSQIDSPDIEKVIVQRNGAVVPPLRSTLAPRQMVTRMNAKSMIHGGTVTYPLSAFEPGAGVTVTIIAIPASGANITRTFSSIELRAIQ